jgi:O-antigen/teichoic acid export membrane protein
MARMYLGGFAALAAVLSLMLPVLVRWSAADAYQDASAVARILLWVPILYGFFYLASGGVWKRQKTGWIPMLMAVALGVNILAMTLAIPRFGIVGAAGSSVLAFLALAFAALWLSERLWKIHCPFIIFAVQLALGLSASAAMIYMEHRQVSFGWRAATVACIVSAIIFVTFRGLGAGEKNES